MTYEPNTYYNSTGNHPTKQFMDDGKTLRCKGIVHDIWWSHQCRNRAQADGYCRTHNPDKLAAAKVERARKEAEAWQMRRVEIAGPKFLDTLRKIADGHNDARTLAKEVIEGYK